ncbi:c-type cytochrome [Marinagarivorans cellulosilyticus]|uniref:Cytochrome c domain-containing protein n=1 Tax=Marinagarivorans cellulosilyticus TaxID=2721545 RepID=A0AAN2BJT6_9GAMM|nr:c-type cytochrome [Marinagarivorans cellulosilyticus]BCD97353.1 hypothetical protein MARGE09_P1554 [Marinagarivorans cellulosilyticus]
MLALKYLSHRKCIALCAYLLLSACTGDTSRSSVASSLSIASSSVTNSSSASSGDMTGGAAYQGADGIKGGHLYAQFWASETGFTLNNSELVDQAQLDVIAQKPLFFACSHCHGWDQLGQMGGNSNLAPNADRPRVADIDLALLAEISSPQALFNRVKDGTNRRSIDDTLADYEPSNNAAVGDAMPAYSDILTDAQIWDIVKFLKEEALDTTALYDLILIGGQYPRGRGFSNLGVDGSDVAGKELFASACADCHGVDGTAVLLAGGNFTVGKYMRNKPFIGQHKAKFGNLGSAMGPVLKGANLGDIQDLFAAMRDKNAFPDVKPEPELEPEPEPEPEPQPEPIDGLLQFLRHCSSCHTGNGEGVQRFGDVTGASAELINFKIQTVPTMAHLKPDDLAQFATLEEIDAIAEFLRR